VLINCFANRVNVCIGRQRVINHDTKTANTFRRLNMDITANATISTSASAEPVQLAAVDSCILLKVSLDEKYLRLRKLVGSCFNE